MKKTLTILVLAIFVCIGQAQEKEEFKPSGKPFIKVFTNYHSIFNDSEQHNAFEIQRAYLGYSYKLSKTISGKVSLDVGNPGVGKYEMTAFLKNAYFQYKDKKLTAKFGLIGLHQYKMQEKQWGGRYLYKSLQDEYKFGTSADLGIFASYKLHDMISVDVTIANGEGYKKVNEVDSLFRYSLGLTISPVEGLKFRAYYDYMGEDNAQQSLAFYAGYSTDKLKLGAEFNQQLNHKEAVNEDFNGLSVYASYKLDKVRLFGRFDNLSSVTLEGEADPWNYGKDGQLMIIGIEFVPVKGLKISPNYQGWLPADGSPTVNGAYLSCEISF